MKKKKNETLEQQRYAREEFLRLKKMQQGEIAPEPKPSEVALVPTTFKGKLQNFWYHRKWAVLVALFLAAVLAVCVTQCVNRVEPDLEVAVYCYRFLPDNTDALIEAYFEPMISDRNGDGKVKVQVINCTFDESSGNTQYQMTVRQKLQALIVADQSAMLFLCDQKGYDNLTELELLSDETVALGEDFYAACAPKSGTVSAKLPDGLRLSVRRFADTAFETKTTAKSCYAMAQKVLDRLKKDLPAPDEVNQE